MKKYGASQYIWLIFVLVLLAVGTTYCRGGAQNGETPTAVISTQTSIVGGWISLDRQVRDAQVLGRLVLLTNSAPPWGQGPEDGEPFIAAFDPHTQKIVWEAEYTSTAPIVANTQNLFVVKNSQLVAVDLNDGDEIWSVPFTDSKLSQVSCDDNFVLAANREAVFAFNVVNGELLWRSDLPVPLDLSVPNFTSFTSWREYSALAIHNRTIYARRLDYQDTDECRFSLFALDANAGSERWRFPIQQSNHGECLPGTLPLAFSDKLVLVGIWDNISGNCVLNALNEDSGEFIWSHQIAEGCSAFTHSIFFDGKFILILTKEILALEAQSGHLLWRRECLPGGPHQLIVDRGWAICRLENATEKTHVLIDLHSGEELDQLEISPPETCRFASSVAGFSNDQLVLVVGNCIQSFNANEGGRLEP